MLKFLLILFAFMYLTFKLGGYIMRFLLGNSGKENQSFKQKPKGGNVSINFDPKDKRNQKGYQGGEYVDYEEVD
ncbi:MAG TPA: hypothetical protein VGA21_00945 [Cyclobacteriaceae bacterium]